MKNSMPGPRVLVLEDEDLVRLAWTEALDAAGYTVVGLADGAEALARLPELTPDLILLDMMMPGMDGFEFLARLRANPVGAQIPVLIVSALGESLARTIDRRGAETLRIAGVLTKSIPVAELLDHVRRITEPGAIRAG